MDELNGQPEETQLGLSVKLEPESYNNNFKSGVLKNLKRNETFLIPSLKLHCCDFSN